MNGFRVAEKPLNKQGGRNTMFHPKYKSAVFFWIAAILWFLFLTVLAAQSAEQSSNLSGWFTGIVLKILRYYNQPRSMLEPLIRKLAHFFGFAMEGLLLGFAVKLTFGWKISPLFALVLCIGCSFLNEFTQLFADQRSCELRDVLIDSSGSALGILFSVLFWWIYLALSRRRNRS